MTIVDVSLIGAGSALDRHRAILASLPNRFRVVERGGDVVLVDTTPADWPAVAARAHDGMRAVVLAAPAMAPVEDVAALGAVPVPTVVSRAYASDRTWIGAIDALVAGRRGAAVLDSVATVPSADAPALDGALLEQFAVVRSLLPTLGTVRLVRRSARHYVLAGTADGTAVTLSGVVSPATADTLTLDLVGIERRWNARWWSTPHARPTEITTMDASGTAMRPLRFESGHRASWARLHDVLSGATPASSITDIAELAANIDTLTSIGALS